MQGHGASLSLALVKASWWMTNGIIAGVHARKRGCTADRKPDRVWGPRRRTFARFCLLMFLH